ncbi:unnamed protein product, partial [Protopolystoma xenopodis]
MNSIKEQNDLINGSQLSILNGLIAAFDMAIKSAFPDLSGHKVVVIPSIMNNFGDYQCNNALSLSKKLLKEKLSPCDPKSVAEKIVKELKQTDFISKIEIADPGFINIWISKEFIIEELSKV